MTAYNQTIGRITQEDAERDPAPLFRQRPALLTDDDVLDRNHRIERGILE